MKKTAPLIIRAFSIAFPFFVLAQQPLQEELYTPLPLQAYTPPKDTNYKENKLIAFNMLENKFDTINSHIANYPSPKKYIPGRIKNKFEKLDGVKDQDYIFTNVQPADQLAEFPNYPVSTVVKLFLNFFNPVNNQTKFATCSGVIIHPGFILTGGHCVKSKFDSSYVVSCTVIPAYNMGKRPFGLTTTTNWYSFTQWTQNGNLDYDMAIMSLSNPIGNLTGWLNWGYHPNDSFFTSPSNVFYSFGYPGYDPVGNPVFEEGERMYYMHGNMDFLKSKNSICHNNIGYSGQSGSGLFFKDSSNIRTAYAVLSHGNLFPPYHTCHCRMDSSMFAYFNSIIPNISNSENKNEPRQILVYPNPTKGIFYLDFSEIQYHSIQIDIFDILGRKLVQVNKLLNETHVALDLTSFPSGSYIIDAMIDEKKALGRIIKTD